MSTKMKGLLKGLRYISQIFDNEKEQQQQDMEIGYPTDVKHVAHIGWDGPSSANGGGGGGGGGTENNGSKPEEGQGGNNNNNNNNNNKNNSQPSRSSRRQSSAGGAALNSEQQEGQRRSRRHHSTASTSSLPREGASRGKNRQPRDGNLDSDSSSHHASDAPKKSRPKKPKDKDGKSEGSSRRAKSQASCDPGSDFSNNEVSAGFEQRASEDESKCNEV